MASKYNRHRDPRKPPCTSRLRSSNRCETTIVQHGVLSTASTQEVQAEVGWRLQRLYKSINPWR